MASTGSILFYISIILTVVLLALAVIKKREKEIELADILVFRLIHVGWILWALAFSVTISLSPYALFESGSIYRFFTSFLPKDAHGFIIVIIAAIGISVGYVLGLILVEFYSKFSLSKIKLSISCLVSIIFLLAIIITTILCVTEPSHTEPALSTTVLSLFLLPVATLILLFPFYSDMGGLLFSFKAE
jgi:hypothetical protein